MMKNVFYFTSIALFVLEIFKFLSWLFDHVAKEEVKTIRQWNLFSQLIECNMRKIFSKNHTQKVVEKLVPDPFLENKNSAYLCINSIDVYTVCFYCIPSWVLSKHIEIKLQATWLYLILSISKKLIEDRK